MSDYAWPANKLPLPTTDLGGDNEESTVRTKMDSGRFRQRGRFTAGLRNFKATWELDDDQWALFQGIVKWKLTRGADWFTIDLPFGNGFKNYRVRFTGKVQFDYQDVMHWKISVPCETEDTCPLTEAETNAALA